MQVVLSAQQLEESSPLISNLINENQLMIANAMYDVETGKVTILEASS